MTSLQDCLPFDIKIGSNKDLGNAAILAPTEGGWGIRSLEALVQIYVHNGFTRSGQASRPLFAGAERLRACRGLHVGLNPPRAWAPVVHKGKQRA